MCGGVKHFLMFKSLNPNFGDDFLFDLRMSFPLGWLKPPTQKPKFLQPQWRHLLSP